MVRECKAGPPCLLKVPIEPHLRFYDHKKSFIAFGAWSSIVIGLPTRTSGSTLASLLWAATLRKLHVGPDAELPYLRNEPGRPLEDPGSAKKFKPRRDVRYYAAVDHYLAVIDAKCAERKGERATTENISKNGAAVLTTMDLHVGDRVKFISEQYDFSGSAVVCNRRDTEDGKARLSIQFVGVAFPIERISTAKKVEHLEEPVCASGSATKI